MQKLWINAAQVVTCQGPGRARRGPEMRDAAIQSHTAVAAERGKIIAVGPQHELESTYTNAERIDCNGGVLTRDSSTRTPTASSERTAPPSRNSERPGSVIWK